MISSRKLAGWIGKTVVGLGLSVLAESCLSANYTAGVQVQLLSLHTTSRVTAARSSSREAPDDAASSRVFQTSSGTEVWLDQANLTISALELLPCSTAQNGVWLEPPGGVVLAHSESTSTRLGTPSLEDFALADNVTRSLGMLTPPAARYCTLRVSLEPADEDAAGLSEAPEMVGVTAAVSGSYRDEAGVLQPFELLSSDATWADLSLGEGGVLLDTPGQVLDLTLQFQYDLWFDQVTLESWARGEEGLNLLLGIQDSLLLGADLATAE